MKQINEANRRPAAILAFILVPLSGLATDLYLPSFPQMTQVFHASPAQVQQTLAAFLISYGVGQFFVGSILDSFGRYRPTLIAIVVFILSNILIVSSRNIVVVDMIRIVQGICASFIAVSKRTFFVDVYTGEQQKSYTALLTIVWAAAPITAPFIGGFLQKHFGWASCFYFLGIYALIVFIFELIYGGETMKTPAPFKLKPMAKVYGKLLNTRDFTVGVVVLGINFCVVMSFNMSIPFIVEKVFHFSPVVTGYCALCSGMALFFGGLLGRKLKITQLFKKLIILSLIQVVFILLMLSSSHYLNDIFVLMTFVMLIHFTGGVLYNLFFTHCLTRFPENAGTAGGITSGGSYIVLSFAINGLLALLTITNQSKLAVSYLILSFAVTVLLLIFRKSILRGSAEIKMESSLSVS